VRKDPKQNPKYNPKIVCAYFKECGLPPPEMEYQFNGDRKFRFDFSWPLYMWHLKLKVGIYPRSTRINI